MSISAVPIAPVSVLGVVMDKPLVQILLKRFHALVEVFTECDPEEFVQHRLVEAFNKAVSLWGLHLGSAVPNVD